jgi:uncharacterized protein YwqG
MPIFGGLFGGKKKGRDEDSGIANHLAFLESLREPAVWLQESKGRGFSKIGGMPDGSAASEWPTWRGEPLSFLCQVDLSEIPPAHPDPNIPRSGCLYFFYDQEQRTWGFDPRDRGSWCVQYEPGPPSGPAERTRPDGLREENVYAEKHVDLCPISPWPDCFDERAKALGLTAGQEAALYDLWSSTFGGQPAHQLLGRPCSIQPDPMDLECQLVSSGVNCGDPEAYDESRAAELERGTAHWTLLLQLDSDEHTRMMWGDCGRLYFWVRKDDLRACRFGECWMILQCY